MISKNEIPVRDACTAFQISKGSYYHWKNSGRQQDLDKYLKKEIQGIALEFPFYGYRRMTKELHRRELQINHKRVLRMMQEDNILCRRKRAFKPVTTQSDHSCKIYPNLAKDMEITGLNQLWVSDITYIRMPQGFVYLAAIIDVFSRKCIGWRLGDDIDARLVLGALEMALEKRKVLGFSHLVHHSDRGVQYASDAYVQRLTEHGIHLRMSRSGNPYDNTFAESFNKTLKVEEVYINEYETFEDAYKNIKQFIELVYNKKRLHSSIGYVPPEEFEREVLKTRAA